MFTNSMTCSRNCQGLFGIHAALELLLPHMSDALLGLAVGDPKQSFMHAL